MQAMMTISHTACSISMTDFYENIDETSGSMKTRGISTN
jgi:hypothetical protein